MRNAIIVSVFLVSSLVRLDAQQMRASGLPEHPIQDNSFLAEEAYNQEPGVVQHIQTFTRMWNSKTWAYSFTQEWPDPEHWKHQLSYTLAGAKADQLLGGSFGDLLLNYRYQLVGTGETRLAVSPRVTLIVPTGSVKNGSGYGGAGVQAVAPASYVLNRHLVSHYDLGGTVIPRARDAAGDRAASYGYSAAGSLIWLAHTRMNGMFETSWSSAHLVSRSHGTDVQNMLWLAPGVRGSFNFRSGLQIVAFFYLSFEHPMWREER